MPGSAARHLVLAAEPHDDEKPIAGMAERA
jgi:hypothetical protein